MTANEMRNLFKELYDGASASEMGYDDVEVSRFLNLAQKLLLNEKFFANRNELREGFEIGSKRDVELNNLKRSLTLWKDVSVTPNVWVTRDHDGTVIANTDVVEQDTIFPDTAVLFEISSDILFIVRDTVDIEYNDIVYRNIKVKNIDEDKANDIVNNPFMKPDITVVYRSVLLFDEDEPKQVKLFIPNNSTFKRWNCTYIKRPRNIVVNILAPTSQVSCELDDLIHEQIVFKAVELAIGATGSQKTQIGVYNSNKNIN